MSARARRGSLALCALLGLLLGAAPARAGAFFFVPGEASDGDSRVDWIAHPNGYDGTGGNVDVSYCIDPTSANAAEMVLPLENVIRTFNALVPTTGNTLLGAANELPFNEVDFESVLLHEVGHSLGLTHPNLGSESGLPPFPSQDQDYARSTRGADGSFDLDDGADAVVASADDLRDDDTNVHWFRVFDNDPFTIGATVDGTSYSRLLADLPGSDSFAAIGSRDVAGLLGVPGVSEAVMHQGTDYDEVQRSLSHDDVATLRLAMAGVDEVQGTSDDYTLTLSYAGLTTRCDVVIDFDDTETSFAKTFSQGELAYTASDHIHMGRLYLPTTQDPEIFFNDGYAWFFNQVSNAPQVPSLSWLGGLGLAAACLAAAGARLRRRA